MVGQAWSRHSHYRRKTKGKKKRVIGPNQVQQLAKQIPLDVKGQEKLSLV